MAEESYPLSSNLLPFEMVDGNDMRCLNHSYHLDFYLLHSLLEIGVCIIECLYTLLLLFHFKLIIIIHHSFSPLLVDI